MTLDINNRSFISTNIELQRADGQRKIVLNRESRFERIEEREPHEQMLKNNQCERT